MKFNIRYFLSAWILKISDWFYDKIMIFPKALFCLIVQFQYFLSIKGIHFDLKICFFKAHNLIIQRFLLLFFVVRLYSIQVQIKWAQKRNISQKQFYVVFFSDFIYSGEFDRTESKSDIN